MCLFGNETLTLSGFSLKGGKSNANTKGSMLFVIKKPFKPVKIIGAVKDPNEPKRPPSAFFVFMEEFRQTYQKEHPQNKSAAAVGMAGGNKWKALSKAEKGMFAAMAEKRKVEYEKKIKMKAYNKDRDEKEDAFAEVNDEDYGV
ncbi:high mobility group B3 [Euphorbia peplus]|nr:high mobility group B3 [Euphorbia peplus]